MNKIRIYRQDKKKKFWEIIESNNYERNKLRENLLEKKNNDKNDEKFDTQS